MLIARARRMRAQSTRAERMLWKRLRASQLDGLKFRRRAPIGSFIADFFCPAARLVVELDGETHGEIQRDRARDAWMHAQGLRVLRFWGDEMTGNMERVLETILIAARSLPPAPSRKGRG